MKTQCLVVFTVKGDPVLVRGATAKFGLNYVAADAILLKRTDRQSTENGWNPGLFARE